MELKIIHFYPDLMSLYGSYANVSVLRRYLEALGCAVTVQPVVPGEGADITGADFLFMGAGTERAQRFAAEDFARYGAAVKAFTSAPTYVNRNPPMQMGIVAFQSTWPSLIYSQLHRLVVKMNVNRVVPIATWLLSPER